MSRSTILLMGGSGQRFGSHSPKQFHRLAGKKVYLYALEALLSFQKWQEIILVVHPSWEKQVMEDLESSGLLSSKISFAPAGATRQASSLSGLRALSPTTELVLIHDAARPFLSLAIIEENLAVAAKVGSADTCIPSADTIVVSQDGYQIDQIPKRVHYHRGQTPQTFHYPLLLAAHEEALKAGIHDASDDCSLVARLGAPIGMVTGSEQNLKITTELDLFLAEQMVRMGLVSPHYALKNSPHPLAGKRYAVAGAMGGIGRAICDALRDEGALPIPIARSSSPYMAELGDPLAVEQLFAKIVEEHGPLDGLINCQGELVRQELSELPLEAIERQVRSNLLSVIYCCKFAPLKQGAHIINLASSCYSRGRASYGVYSATKAAVVNFTQALAEERPDLMIHSIAPQRTATSMRASHFPGEEATTLLDPEEVASAILTALKSRSASGSVIDIRK